MPLTHFTDRHIVRILATQTRRTDLTPHELSRTHVALGRFLAGELVERLPLERYDIPHPQGVRPGWRIADEPGVALMCVLRAGLYSAEGVREVLPRAPVFHVAPRRDVGLAAGERNAIEACGARAFVIIDAVVNTGATLEPVLAQLRAHRDAALVAVLALVAPTATAERMAAAHPGVHFLFARLSDNQYVGRGATDTGNRLFGTFPDPAKDPT